MVFLVFLAMRGHPERRLVSKEELHCEIFSIFENNGDVYEVEDFGITLYINYPPKVSSMKYCCLGVSRKEYSRLITK